jgi:hypothetical protein
MVIIKTKAAEVNIQAVSPLSIFGRDAGSGETADPDGAAGVTVAGDGDVCSGISWATLKS